MEGIRYVEDFLSNTELLFDTFNQAIDWDDRMKSKRTASFGIPYNYSQMSYAYQPFTTELRTIIDRIQEQFQFRPNNCLINFYRDGKASMGFHSDRTDVLSNNTGVVIISLGATRTLQFRRIEDQNQRIDFQLISGSLLHMTNEVQNRWQHAILKSTTSESRMSLTFRKLK